MILCDTRERKWEHVREWFDANGIDYRSQKLDFGDYMAEGRSGLTIDRKAGLGELATNLCTDDHGRFWREMRGAHKARIRVIVLIEDDARHVMKDVLNWQSPYAKISGRMLFEKMFSVANAYGVEFRFCKRAEAGAVIARILEEVSG